MLKSIFFLFFVFFSYDACAQMSLVKDLAKKASSSNPMDLIEVLDKIEPAFTNPESANDVLTWYTAGKAAFAIYDEMYKMKLMQQPVDDNMMNEILSSAYAFYMEALPLDSVVEVDKKTGMPKLNSDGSKKVKTKYSKEIIGALTSHMGDIAAAGNTYLQNSDWENAANAFGNYANLAILNGLADADIIGQVRFFEGYSLYQIQKFAEAYDAFTQARKLGYTENNIVDFQISSLANMVQGMLDNNEYDKANAFIDNALKANPKDGILYDIKGFTTELKDGVDAALPFYRKAAEVDPTYANAFFDVGRCLYLQAQKIIDDNPNATSKDIISMIEPIYNEAINYLKKASILNPDDGNATMILLDIQNKLNIANGSSYAKNQVNNRTSGSTHYISMSSRNGVYYIPAAINGVEMEFVFDTGASSVSISRTEALFLYKQGKLYENDIKGSGRFVDATGKINSNLIVNLRFVTIGGITINNVEALVVDNLDAPLLLGQSVLSRFGRVTIDYKTNRIYLED